MHSAWGSPECREQVREAIQQSPELSSYLITVIIRSMARRNRRAAQLLLQVHHLNNKLERQRDDLERALRRRPGPAMAQRSGESLCYSAYRAMAVDPELLEILVCPKSHGELEVVDLPVEVCRRLVEKYHEHFRDEEPVVEQGLLCAESQLVYPVVSDIPIMLVDEALPADVLAAAEARDG